MATDKEFVQIDVGADGSCFYRAVYGAARHHHTIQKTENGFSFTNSRVLEQLYACLLGSGLRNVLGIRNNNAALHAAEFINNEDVFVDTIRGYLASIVANTDFLTQFARREDPKAKNLYKQYHEWAITGDPLFEFNMLQASQEFRDEFGDPEVFAELSEEEFKDAYAAILLDKSVYAAESEYMMVQFLLNTCGIQLESVNPDYLLSPPKLQLVDNGRPLLLLRRLLRMEHYAYIMDKAYYEANKEKVFGPDKKKFLREWRKNKAIYSMARWQAKVAKAAEEEAEKAAKAIEKAAKEAEKAAKEAEKAAKKEGSAAKKEGSAAKTRKGNKPTVSKTRRKAPVNNSSGNNAAIAAKLAEMGYIMENAPVNIVQSIRNSLK